MPLRANQKQRRRAADSRRSDRPRYELFPLEQRLLLSATTMIAKPALALGNLTPPAIGGEVFYDDANALTVGQGQTSSGHGLPNVEVDLYSPPASGAAAGTLPTLDAIAITDAEGDYGFENLTSGNTYTVQFDAPPQYLIGPLGASPNALLNSVAVASNDTVPIIGTYTTPALATNSLISDINCGMFTNGTTLPIITGTVFNDLNNDGIPDDPSPTGGGQATIANVTVNLLNPNTQAVVATTTTDSNGVYSFTNALTIGSSYLVQFVTPAGYLFSKPFATSVPTGYSWANQTTGIVETPNEEIGNARFQQNPSTQTFTVNPNLVLVGTSDTAQTDVECGMYAEVIKITGPSASIPRPHTAPAVATFTVTITPANTSQTITVGYTTVNGTAIAGVDYTAESGTLTFTPGVSVLTIAVPILPSNTPELNLNFSVTITPPAGEFVTAANVLSATATIQNTNYPSVAINNLEAPRPTTTPLNFVFTVTLSETAPFPVEINYFTIDASALAGTNYTQEGTQTNPLTLTIPANTLTGTISVPVLPGTGPTQSKSFLVQIQDVTNLTFETSAASATAEGAGIIDSNAAPQLSVAGGQVTESLIGNFLLPFTVTVAPAPIVPVTINYATSDGTAVAGLDYAATSGSLTFAPGQASQVVNVLAYRRFLSAQDLTVNLTVTDPSGTYDVITPTAVGTIQDVATVALPVAAKQRVTYTDYLNNPVTVAMKGPGSGTLVFLGSTSVETNAYEIVLTGTTAATTLSVATRHNLQTSFINILDDSSLGTISAKSTNVLGLVTIDGSLNALSLDYVQGATISVGPGTGTLAVNFLRAVDTSITSAIPIKSLTATSYVNSDGLSDVITAPSVGPIRVKKGFGGTVVQTVTPATAGRVARATASVLRSAGAPIQLAASANPAATADSDLINETV